MYFYYVCARKRIEKEKEEGVRGNWFRKMLLGLSLRHGPDSEQG